jgi:hypothetical protein
MRHRVGHQLDSARPKRIWQSGSAIAGHRGASYEWVVNGNIETARINVAYCALLRCRPPAGTAAYWEPPAAGWLASIRVRQRCDRKGPEMPERELMCPAVDEHVGHEAPGRRRPTVGRTANRRHAVRFSISMADALHVAEKPAKAATRAAGLIKARLSRVSPRR